MRAHFLIFFAAIIGIAFVARDMSAQDSEPFAGLVMCIDYAEDETLLSVFEAENLCFGTQSTGPALCYESARDRTFLSTHDAIFLCRCAESTLPVDCFEELDDETDYVVTQILSICNTIAAQNLWPDCIARPR